MTGRLNFPSYLYVRVDKPLRAALVGAAQAEGVTVSDLARRELRKALATPLASAPATAGASYEPR